MPPIPPSPFLYRVKGSYFADCERDDGGHCLPSGEQTEAKDALAKLPSVRYLGIKDAVRTPLKTNENYPSEIDSLLKARVEKARAQRDGWSVLRQTVSLDELVAIQGAVSRSGVEKKIDDPQSGLTQDPPNNLGLVVQYQGVKYVWDGTHRIAAAALQGQLEIDTYFIDLDEKEVQQVPPSPFRKRLPLQLAKDLSYLSETAGGALVPPLARGGTKDGPPESSEIERAKHSDLITLPDGIEGTNCGNCSYIRETFCVHPEVNQEVTPRMCCKYWDAPGTHRAWEKNGKKNVDGFLTKKGSYFEECERDEGGQCLPSGRVGQKKPPGLTGHPGSEGPDKVTEKKKKKRKVETEERRATEVEHARNVARAAEEGRQEGKPKKPAASRGEMAEARREGKGKEAKIVMGDGEPAPEHIKASMVPPDWTDVRVSLDPKADVLVTARDKAGRVKTVYSDQHHMRQAALKFARIREYQIKRREMFQQNQRNRQGKNKEEADCSWLMMVQGTRPGSDKDVKARVKAYGATTLRAEHVVIGEDGSVRLQFTGKEGVYHNHLIRDRQLAEMLKERAYSADERGGKLFDTSADRVQSYSRTLDGGSFTPKDFRTGRANSLAGRLIGDMDTPTDEKSYKKAVKQVAERVSSVLGNRPAQALESYIDPTVFSGWRNHVGV